MDPRTDPPGVYHGSAPVGDPVPAATCGPVPAARWVAFARALLRGHHAMADGRCGCGHWLSACDVRVMARRHGVPVEPHLSTRLRIRRIG